MKIIPNWHPKTNPLVKEGQLDEELIKKLILNVIPPYPDLDSHINAYIFSLSFLTKEYILKWDIKDLIKDFNKINIYK